ncbi:TetR/AcrR family transcriptional regulator [Nocardia yamanashiensis]|uniref:TetR/AcrR family transcriptional regulator n=1 Tax=Nocardia yamanashiensis TaxID=209247 RepID=UPI001E63BB19|nr:TetR/AcrR family transcriptional regulator [Nocardia yamanashiensis]UGT41707.1 TetR/AcrR family transcriptional regulator [Nocardia yamanashiensis]
MTEPLSGVDQAILKAAREAVIEFGVKRTTLTEVAKRAGVSRPTVYRRWSHTGALVADLLVLELREIVWAAVPATGPSRARLVTAVTEASARMRANPVFGKIFRADTDLMLTYVFERLGRNQRKLITLFTTVIQEGQRDGSIRAGDPRHMATMLLLITQSAVQSAGTVADWLDAEHLDIELAHAVDAYLMPPATTQ